MRLRGRQGRFVALTLASWIGARVWTLWPAGIPSMPQGVGIETVSMADAPAEPVPAVMSQPNPPAASPSSPHRLPARLDLFRSPPCCAAKAVEGTTPVPPPYLPAREVARPTGDATVTPANEPPAVRRASTSRRLQASTYAFVRPGSGRAVLAPGGMLGSSQIAARVAFALNDGPVRLAAAARLYAPLHQRGAEAAAGLDWHPWPEVPLRVSIEHRFRLDRAGRSAWSAYAAGGFYRGDLPLGLEADGYAQAGVVGAERRDLFADGGLRLGHALPIRRRAIVGAGLWGAAQPRAARLDLGPRASLSLPLADHALTVAIEGRLRVAGRAAPGSGAALTLTADF